MRHPFIRSIFLTAILFVLIAGLFWLSCTHKAPLDPSDTHPEDAVLLSSLTVVPAQLLSGGYEATISVKLVDLAGNGLADKTISFISNSLEKGTVTASAITDETGWAEVTFTSGNEAGEAIITARYGVDVSGTIKISIVSASESLISIAAGRSSLLASGVDTTMIMVTVLGDSSKPVSGASVSFTRTAGTITPSAITNSNGLAQALLFSAASVDDITSTITATYDTLTIPITIAFRGITLDVGAHPTALQADGQSKSVITAVIKETSSFVAVGGSPVVFSTNSGLIPNIATTDASGVAKVDLTAASVEDTAHVFVRYGNLLKDSVDVVFTLAPPSNYTLQPLIVDKTHIIANGVDQAVVTAKVLDDQENPAAGIAVAFIRTAGAIATQGITNNYGIAEVKLIASASEFDITSTVTATLGQQTPDQDIDVIFDGVEMQINAMPDTILSDGQSQSTVRIILKRSTSKEAISNATIRFGLTRGTIPAEAITNSSGVVDVSLTSDVNPGSAVVSARYGLTIEKQDTVVYSTQAPSQYVLSDLSVSDAALLANGFDQSQITATVVDDEGQPVNGVVVGFNVDPDRGSIQLSAVTNNSGKATAVFTAPALEDSVHARISAYINQQSMQTVIIAEGVSVNLTTNFSSILANGQSKAIITATVKRTESNVGIEDANVIFGTTYGTIPNQGITNSSGVAQVELTSSTTQRPSVSITARYGNRIFIPIIISFEASIPHNLQVTTTPPVIIADGQSQSQIKVMVTDDNNNPVPDGTSVTFEMQDGATGSLERQKSTVNGIAISMLTAGTVPDTANVTVTVGTLVQTVNVVYVVGDASEITVTIDETSIMADGLENATVTARVLDAQGTPIEGLTVFFTTNLGDVTPSNQTDADGYAIAQFSSGEVGAAFITATVNLADGSKVSGAATIVAVPGDPNSIVLRFSPTAIGVRETGQNQTSIIEAEVRDSKNNPVADGVNVQFRIVAAPSMTAPGGPTLTPALTDVPTVGGKARASLSSGTISGNVRIEASVNTIGGPIAKASEILIHAGPPYMEHSNDYASTHLTIAAEQLNIWKTLGTTVVSIAVFDRYHNPVQEGTAVYLTTSGGGISTHTAYTDKQGLAEVILTGANPQPHIHKFYYGDLVQDPNSGAVLPGPTYYIDLDEFLLPNFEADIAAEGKYNLLGGTTSNTMNDSLFVTDTPRYSNADGLYQNLENDGIARIVAYTEGHDLAGNPVRAWDQISVVYSGAVSYDDDTETTLRNDTLNIGQARTFIFSLIDGNGNPIESNTSISAALTGEVDAKLAWTELETSNGWGKDYYKLTITNNIDPSDTDAKVGYTKIKITWKNEHQSAYEITEYGVIIANRL